MGGGASSSLLLFSLSLSPRRAPRNGNGTVFVTQRVAPLRAIYRNPQLGPAQLGIFRRWSVPSSAEAGIPITSPRSASLTGNLSFQWFAFGSIAVCLPPFDCMRSFFFFSMVVGLCVFFLGVRFRLIWLLLEKSWGLSVRLIVGIDGSLDYR